MNSLCYGGWHIAVNNFNSVNKDEEELIENYGER